MCVCWFEYFGAGSSSVCAIDSAHCNRESNDVDKVALRWPLHLGLVLLSFLKNDIVFLGLPKREKFVVCLPVPKSCTPAEREILSETLI